ncbi:chemotaxis protein CheD [Noviherbaspirillum sp. 17J57-3]|uniref:Probable chemoreceptor glutamine deamidase CheD n=1 Tax=Noviherbaspirillum galbum TaxID=2709383 RepID=A0A6B3SJ94_9BURK|nr:chemotaxis protein CheD [Noviherbaspirillum galbum]
MTVFLNPGEYFVGDEGYRISTLLGSCVSITLWHPERLIGAMSHFVLATRGRTLETPDGRYGDEVLELMIGELAALDIKATDCKAKIFGGGNMFTYQATGTPIDIGKRNGEAARRLLQLHRIPIASESLFGRGHRKIVFDIRTGHVWSRHAEQSLK